MFERFTDGARHTLVLSQEEARALRAVAIGPEHLLLGLLRDEGGNAALVLRASGVELAAARSAAKQLAGPSRRDPGGSIPFTRQAKAALERAVAGAPRLGYPDIQSEHLLAGVLGESGGPAEQLLLALGVEPDRVRQELTDLVPVPPPVPGPVARFMWRRQNRLRRRPNHLGW